MRSWASSLGLLLLAVGCARREPPSAADVGLRVEGPEERRRMDAWAIFPEDRPTGVAVAMGDRVFVSFPYWEDPHDISVIEIDRDGNAVPYPDRVWNGWDGDNAGAAGHFVCVQSVWADHEGGLWILDAGSPRMEGVVTNGPKLVHVDLRNDAIDAVYAFDRKVAHENSYLNDVRVDLDKGFAYLTDSGTGALVVLDLSTREARRVLGRHVSTAAEDVVLNVQGNTLDVPFDIHADGIALDPDGRYLYWHALTGRTLYRIDTDVLTDAEASNAAVRAAVEDLGETVVTDGMEFDRDGRLLHTAIEHDAIVAYDPKDGSLEMVIQDPRLAWPDSLAVARNGRLFVTTSRIHEMPWFNEGEQPTKGPFGLWVVAPPGRVSQR